MYKLCKTEASSKRQREIENTLFDMMDTVPYNDITVTELCARAGIPRKAFYRYFDSKDDVLYAYLEHTLADFDGFRPGKEVAQRRSLPREIEGYFRFWHTHKHVLDTLDKNNLLQLLISITLSFPIDNMISLKKFLPGDDDFTRPFVFRFAIAGLLFTMLEWYKRGFDTDTKEMARLACRTLSKPLITGILDSSWEI